MSALELKVLGLEHRIAALEHVFESLNTWDDFDPEPVTDKQSRPSDQEIALFMGLTLLQVKALKRFAP